MSQEPEQPQRAGQSRRRAPTQRRGSLLYGLVAIVAIAVVIGAVLLLTGGAPAAQPAPTATSAPTATVPGPPTPTAVPTPEVPTPSAVMPAATAQPAATPVTPSASTLVLTPAVRSDWYEVYFTSPKTPDDQKAHRGGIDQRLVVLYDSAQRTLDVAVYDFDLANVADAMARAKARGVRVRMYTDSDTVASKDEKVRAALQTVRKAGIAIGEDKRQSIMHHKFSVVDGEWVATGSMNYTDGDAYRLNNWTGIFHSRDLAAAYTFEFEQLIAGKTGSERDKARSRASFTIGGTPVQLCFSPRGSCASLIVDTVKREAKTSIYFLAFSFTHDAIGASIIDKAKAGLRVSGVFERTGSQTAFSEYPKMKKQGLDVYLDGNPYAMHHKVIVLDERVVVAGSFNFSNNADQDNDENLLIVDDAAYARAFKAEFDRVLDVAKRSPQQ